MGRKVKIPEKRFKDLIEKEVELKLMKKNIHKYYSVRRR